MKTKYRKLSFLTDIPGMKTSLGDMLGIGFPKQPILNKKASSDTREILFDEDWVIKTLAEKVARHPANSLEYPFQGEKIFEEPLVGFVRGDDPLFEDFKKVIGPFHFTPREIMAWQASKNGIPAPEPEDISVVSFILPISKATRAENGRKDDWPSERWAQTRRSGEIFSQTIVQEIVKTFMDAGVLAVAPDMTPMFNFKKHPGVGWASPWSHRHVAYAAGLGTFGMNDLLITEKGSAHRCGSFVANIRLRPNRERNENIHAHCLQYQGIPCLKCQQRCPVQAVSESGHDKAVCGKRVIDSIKYCNRNYHIFIYGCGLCSTRIPCENSIPKELRELPSSGHIEQLAL
jgi:hypothetical protein